MIKTQLKDLKEKEQKKLNQLKLASGSALREVRSRKDLVQEEFFQQLGNRKKLGAYENGEKSIPFEELIVLLNNQNASLDEFIYLMDNEYISTREILAFDLSREIGRLNIAGLKKVHSQALQYNEEQHADYFLHIAALAKANIVLLETNSDFKKARKEVTLIREYLENAKCFFFYDLILLSQCLFLFEIKLAFQLVKKALDYIDEHYEFYKYKVVPVTLTLGLAIYALDFPDYFRHSLELSKKAETLSIEKNYLDIAIRAKIVQQISCFKIGNGLYNQDELVNYLNILKTVGWLTDYNYNKDFIEKHGISLP